MPKGIPNQIYTGEFKQKVVEPCGMKSWAIMRQPSDLGYGIRECRIGNASTLKMGQKDCMLKGVAVPVLQAGQGKADRRS